MLHKSLKFFEVVMIKFMALEKALDICFHLLLTYHFVDVFVSVKSYKNEFLICCLSDIIKLCISYKTTSDMYFIHFLM